MVTRDFQRQMPGASHHFDGGRGWFERLHLDPALLLLLVILCTVGLAILYSASGQSEVHLKAQLTRYGLAFGVMLVFAQFSPDSYRRWSPWLYVLGVGALLAVMFFGTGAKGAQRWLQLPGLPRFQPSEFMKLIMPMMIAWFLASRYLPPSIKSVFTALVLVFVPVFLVVKQPDLGTSILIAASGLFVIMFAGVSWRLVGGFALVVASLAPLMWMFVMRDYQKQRVLTFLEPESDPLGAGWNIIQSKTTIGSGGLWGKGWLEGTQSQLNFLPESHTDFIIAVCAEEFGFIGVLALLGLYLLIVIRGLVIAMNAQDSYARLLGGSLVLTFFIYVFVNIGMVSGILPVVGVPLPLISYGGTSAVTLMAAFGVLMSIQTHRRMLSK